MKRSYVGLFLAILALAVALTVVGRWSRAPRAPEPGARAAVAPMAAITIEIGGDSIRPALSAVPKGDRVRLRVVNRSAKAAHLSLSGYEDHLAIPTLLPRDHWTGTFLADRPGEDFAWMLNGAPAGKLAVTGSHLEDGHR